MVRVFRLDGIDIWKQFEELLIPGLRLSVIERAAYSHLRRRAKNAETRNSKYEKRQTKP
jgi:hypothetical protein